jgi:hypothetical protein
MPLKTGELFYDMGFKISFRLLNNAIGDGWLRREMGG